MTPIDIDDVRYEYTPIGNVNNDVIDENITWAEDFMADTHAACIDSLIATLWSDEYDETGSWIKAIRLWLKRGREAERKEREQRRNAARGGGRPDRNEQYPRGRGRSQPTSTTSTGPSITSLSEISSGSTAPSGNPLDGQTISTPAEGSGKKAIVASPVLSTQQRISLSMSAATAAPITRVLTVKVVPIN